MRNIMMAKDKVKYTGALAKNRALIAETIKVFQVYEDGDDFAKLSKKVNALGVLAPLSSNRITDILNQGIKKRYFADSALPSRMKTLSNLPYQDFAQSILLYTARNDNFLYDFIKNVYWPLVDIGKQSISKADVQTFIRDAVESGAIGKPWNADMQEYVIQGLFQAMVDFGFLTKAAGETRQIVRFKVSDRVLLYLAYDLHFAGYSDTNVFSHPDWSLFLQSRDEVRWHFDKMGLDNHIVYQQAADSLHITWLHKDMKEVLHALVG